MSKIEKQEEIVIPAGETIDMTIGFEVDYEFPKELVLQRKMNDGKILEYSFSLDK